MKLIYTLLTILLMQTTIVFAQDSFVSGFEDLPLMEGLLNEQEELYFDTPSGKIIEAYAYSDALTAKQVYDFYKSTLPQLGWKYKNNNTFTRENEKLVIEASTKKSTLNIKFFLQPEK